MKKRINEKTCSHCIHEYACAAWNVGNISNADASHCVNYETVKDSTAYFIGYNEGLKKGSIKDDDKRN